MLNESPPKRRDTQSCYSKGETHECEPITMLVCIKTRPTRVMQSLSRVREHTMQQFTAVLSPWKSRPIMPLPLSRKVVLYDGPPGRLVKERVA
eukprot:1180417-Prorocentrum_minimum.AAC.1